MGSPDADAKPSRSPGKSHHHLRWAARRAATRTLSWIPNVPAADQQCCQGHLWTKQRSHAEAVNRPRRFTARHQRRKTGGVRLKAHSEGTGRAALPGRCPPSLSYDCLAAPLGERPRPAAGARSEALRRPGFGRDPCSFRRAPSIRSLPSGAREPLGSMNAEGLEFRSFCASIDYLGLVRAFHSSKSGDAKPLSF
jgi:hypothetical protein